MEHSGGIQASLSGRYAKALFDLAVAQNALDTVAASVVTVGQAMRGIADLRALVRNPLVSRQDATNAIRAVATALKLDPLTSNFLGVLANNSRFNALPAIITAFERMAAEHRGEVTAEVTSAYPLNDTQLASLKAKLKTRIGNDVAIKTQINPAILGGLIVKIGSQMIDSSISTKLNTLALAMKG